MATADPFGEIRCHHCHQWFRSPIQFDHPHAFLSSSLIGGVLDCPLCGQPTVCDTEHMRWRRTDEGVVGSDTS